MNPNATKHAVREQLIMETPLGSNMGITKGGGAAVLELHNLYDPFDLLPPVGATAAQKDLHFSITGTGTVPAPVMAARGGVTIATRTTSAADNDEARLFPFTASAWGTVLPPADNKFQMIEARLELTQITNTQFYFGWKLTDTGVVATDANQTLFLFDTDATANFGPAGSGTLAASPNWYAINSSAGNDVAKDTGVPVAAATSYLLQIAIDVDRRARFYLNRRLVHTAITAIPTTANLLATWGIASRDDAGAAKSYTVRHGRRVASVR